MLLLGEPSSYVQGFAKPCAEFYPTVALRFSLPKSLAALLLYPNCKTARLVTSDGAAHPFLNIDPIADQLDLTLPTTWRSK